jgi:hypothetical protein
MKKRDGLLRDIEEDARALPVGWILTVLALELAILACAALIRFIPL